MDVSLIFARILGLYFFTIGLGITLNRDYYTEQMKRLTNQPALLLVMSVMTLFLGAIAINFHHIWSADWRISITLICWITLFKGVFNIIFPTIANKMTHYLNHHQQLLTATTAFSLLVGGFYLYKGF